MDEVMKIMEKDIVLEKCVCAIANLSRKKNKRRTSAGLKVLLHICVAIFSIAMKMILILIIFLSKFICMKQLSSFI